MPRERREQLALLNAGLAGQRVTVRIEGGRIAAIGHDAPRREDLVVDLRGDRILPGLINAHDHLQLNSLPRPTDRRRYRHVRDWIGDIDTQRRVEGELKRSVAVPLEERLLLGGVKNLLSGVTTVAHHDPLFLSLRNPAYPVQVVANYGWSHSLYLDGEDKVCDSYLRTPAAWPWIIHAAEGVDTQARAEFERLDALGCLGANTLIVHGVALDERQRRRLIDAAAGLLWCPVSNHFLFGTTARVTALLRAGRVALGTDSRLTGSRDLLDELRVAVELGQLDGATAEALVTCDAARLLRLADCGALETSARADILVLPAGMPLSQATRADVRLVMVGGIARYGDRDYLQALRQDTVEVRVDGRAKHLDGDLAAVLSAASAQEPGLELTETTRRRVGKTIRENQCSSASC